MTNRMIILRILNIDLQIWFMLKLLKKIKKFDLKKLFFRAKNPVISIFPVYS
jgi:hypothetical protein